MLKSWQNSTGVTTNGGAKCKWGRPNTGVVAENWQLLMWRVVNLAQLQVYHTQRARYLFAACLLWYSALRRFVSNSYSLLSTKWHQKTGPLTIVSQKRCQVFHKVKWRRVCAGIFINCTAKVHGERWYRDSAGNTVENSTIFSPIQTR